MSKIKDKLHSNDKNKPLIYFFTFVLVLVVLFLIGIIAIALLAPESIAHLAFSSLNNLVDRVMDFLSSRSA